MILETHVHADHLTASIGLDATGSKTGVGSGIREVRATFGEVNASDIIDTEDPPYDKLFDDGEKFKVGDIDARVIATPGHTPSCVTYIIGNACFIGDTMFMPDSGTARCDFPGGDAKQLFGSLQKIFSLPDEMRLFVCHDYGAGGVRDFAWETTVGEQRRSNIHISGGVKEDDYVQMRSDRDATLSLPRLLSPLFKLTCVQAIFPVEENGTSYIKVPLNVFQTRDSFVYEICISASHQWVVNERDAKNTGIKGRFARFKDDSYVSFAATLKVLAMNSSPAHICGARHIRQKCR